LMDFYCPLEPNKYSQNPPWYNYQALKLNAPVVTTPSKRQFNNRILTLKNFAPYLDAHWFGCVAEGGEYKSRVRSATPPKYKPSVTIGNASDPGLNCMLRDVVLFQKAHSDELGLRFDFGMCKMKWKPEWGPEPPKQEETMELSAMMGIHRVPDLDWSVHQLEFQTHLTDFFSTVCNPKAGFYATSRRMSEKDDKEKANARSQDEDKPSEEFFHPGPPPELEESDDFLEGRRLSFLETVASWFGGGGGVFGKTFRDHPRFIFNVTRNGGLIDPSDKSLGNGVCIAHNAEYARCVPLDGSCFSPFRFFTLLDDNHEVASIPVAETQFDKLYEKFFGKPKCPPDLRDCTTMGKPGKFVDRDPDNFCKFRPCSEVRRMAACDEVDLSNPPSKGPCALSDFFVNATKPKPINPCQPMTAAPTPAPAPPPAPAGDPCTTPAPAPTPPPYVPTADPCTTTTTTSSQQPQVPGKCWYDLVCVKMVSWETDENGQPIDICKYNDCRNVCDRVNEETKAENPEQEICCNESACCWSVELWCLLIPGMGVILALLCLPGTGVVQKPETKGETQWTNIMVVSGGDMEVANTKPIVHEPSKQNLGPCYACTLGCIQPLILAIICFGLGYGMEQLYKHLLNQQFKKDPDCPCDLWQYLFGMWLCASIGSYWMATGVDEVPPMAHDTRVEQSTVVM